MDNQLFLSIIIPVYNMEHYIVPCLESIFANRDIEAQLQISVAYFCSIGLYFLV